MANFSGGISYLRNATQLTCFNAFYVSVFLFFPLWMESLQPRVHILVLKFGLTPKQDFREHWLIEPKHLLDDGNLLQVCFR